MYSGSRRAGKDGIFTADGVNRLILYQRAKFHDHRSNWSEDIANFQFFEYGSHLGLIGRF